MIDNLGSLYEKLQNGKIRKMDVQIMDESEKVINYLGMDFDYSTKGELSIFMR